MQKRFLFSLHEEDKKFVFFFSTGWSSAPQKQLLLITGASAKAGKTV
jgi:hypothetical protein